MSRYKKFNKPLIQFRLLSPEGAVVGYERWNYGKTNREGVYVESPHWEISHDGENWFNENNGNSIFHTYKQRLAGRFLGVEIYEGDEIGFEYEYPFGISVQTGVVEFNDDLYVWMIETKNGGILLHDEKVTIVGLKKGGKR